MTMTSSPQSIHNLSPLETGGVIARGGFIFQDHVAVRFCLQMIDDPALSQVWCERQDDITLIWNYDSGEEVEFVQVKNNQFDQLWTIAKLCDREKTSANQAGVGQSILEKSLAQDRCIEPCCFRIVTSRDVHSDIKCLTYPRGHSMRSPSNSKYVNLIEEIRKRLGTIASSNNGNNYEFWVHKTLWEIQHSDVTLKQSNLLTLSNYLSTIDIRLSPDQIEQKIYNKILKKVQDAACADGFIYPDAKRILRNELILWVNEMAREYSNLPSVAGGKRLQTKMEKALLSPETIATAHESRRYYREQRMNPKYFDPSDSDLIDNEVLSLLQNLRAQLDALEIQDNGLEFHLRCIKALDILRDNLQTNPKPPISVLHGCMYSITDRCLHRFQRDES